MNESRTCSKSDPKLTQPRSGPVRYELVDKDGNPIILRSRDGKVVRRLTFETAVGAAEHAKHLWPDQEQDEDRTGKGWDIQVVGCDRSADKTR